MSTGIEVEQESRDGVCVVRLSGTLDLSLGDQQILPEEAQQIIFDFDGIRRVTSFGILMWTRALEELSASYLAMWRCRPCIVQQLNVVADFAGRCEVLSVYLPYVCEDCDKEFDVLWDLSQRHAAALKCELGTELCPKCRKPAVFDDIPANYFAFAKRIAAPAPAAWVAARLLTVQMDDRALRRDPAPSRPRVPASGTLSTSDRAHKHALVNGKGGD